MTVRESRRVLDTSHVGSKMSRRARCEAARSCSLLRDCFLLIQAPRNRGGWRSGLWSPSASAPGALALLGAAHGAAVS